MRGKQPYFLIACRYFFPLVVIHSVSIRHHKLNRDLNDSFHELSDVGPVDEQLVNRPIVIHKSAKTTTGLDFLLDKIDEYLFSCKPCKPSSTENQGLRNEAMEYVE